MQKKEIKGTNEFLYYEKAKNGLSIFLWQNKNCHNTYAAINVNYGSCYYRYKCKNNIVESKTGIAHFLEHVSFNLGKNKDASDVFERLGTFSNAYTDNKNTCYYIMYQDQEYKNLSTLFQIALKPYITNSNVEKEKGIIIEELRRSLNNPYYKLYYQLMNNLFKNNNLRETTLGSMEDIKTITAADLIQVHDDFYNPYNMQLVICGNINPEKTMATINKIISNYPEKKYDKKQIYYPTEPKEVLKEKDVIYGNVKIPKVKLSYKFNRKDFKVKDDKALAFIINIIIKSNFGVTSDFREQLVVDDKVNAFSCNFMIDKSNVVIGFTIEDDNYEAVIKKIKQKVTELSLSKEEFIAKTHSIKAQMITDFESNEIMADNIINCLTKNNKFEYNIFNMYTSIKYQDVVKIMKLLKFENYAQVVLKPQKK